MTNSSAKLAAFGNLVGVLNLGSVGLDTITLNFNGLNQSFGIGAGAGNFNTAYLADRTVTNGTPDVLNLTSGLTGPDGVALSAFADIVAFAIKNNSTVAGQILSVGAGTDPVTTLWGAGPIIVPPGACVAFIDPSAAGYAITTTTADRINVTVAAGSGVSYTTLILGH